MSTKTSRTWLGGLGIIVVISIFITTGGHLGALAAVIVAASWYVLSPIAAFTIGQFALAGLFTSSTAWILLAIAECSLIGILTRPPADTTCSARFTAVVMSSIALFAVGSWAGYHWLDSIWRATVVLAVVTAGAAYGLHRYERIALGLVTDTTSSDYE